MILAQPQPLLDLLIGQTISHVWFGQGSVLFLELGLLSEGRKRKDGTIGNAQGEMTIMLSYDWRIERPSSIVLGSGDTQRRLNSVPKKLIGATIRSAKVVGRLPELVLEISNGLWLVTFTIYQGQPTWSVGFKALGLGWLAIKRGKLCVEQQKT